MTPAARLGSTRTQTGDFGAIALEVCECTGITGSWSAARQQPRDVLLRAHTEQVGSCSELRTAITFDASIAPSGMRAVSSR